MKPEIKPLTHKEAALGIGRLTLRPLRLRAAGFVFPSKSCYF
ncbi:MAG: hypothetical protein AB7G44_12660 [Bacteroidia bacterium]